jgi:hypothetical protein
MSAFKTNSTVEGGGDTLETRLWRAAISRTIQEWISGPLRSQLEARQYLFEDTSDFILVCESAGIDGKRLRSRLACLHDNGVLGHLRIAA